jgi:hypothetical protein
MSTADAEEGDEGIDDPALKSFFDEVSPGTVLPP